MVEWCGGTTGSQVNTSTNVLVTELATGYKFAAARKLGIPVVRKDWIEHSFRAQAVAELERIKPLQGANILLSGYSPSEYDKWARRIEDLGASFSKNFTSTITHLIIDLERTTTGPRSKYYQAKQNGIIVVKRNWFDACASRGVWVPEAEFEICQPDDPKLLPTAQPRIPPSSPNTTPPSSQTSSSRHNSFAVDIGPAYLRGCNVYLHTLAGSTAPLQSIIRSAQGSETAEVHNATHIVASLDDGTALLSTNLISHLESCDSKPLLVAHTWLESCVSARSMVDVAPYLLQYDVSTRLASLSTASSNNQSHTPTNQKKRAREPVIIKDNQSDSEELIMPVEIAEPAAKRPTLAPQPIIASAAPTGIFDSFHFISAFPHEQKLRDLIVELGGTYWVLGQDLPASPNRLFLILPHGFEFTPLRLPVNKIRERFPLCETISFQWLEHCKQTGQVQPTALCPALFTPLPYAIEQYKASMSSFNICIASVKGMEHDFILILGHLLGCKISDLFKPKSTTHVISLVASGKKQDMAIQGRKFLVKPEWLYCCALSGRPVSEIPYLLTPPIIAAPISTSMQSQPTHQPNIASASYQFADTASNVSTGLPFVSAVSTFSNVPIKKLAANIPFHSILSGAVIYIGRIKSHEADEMKNLAKIMGAEVVWTFDTNVTHVVTYNKADMPQAPPPTTSFGGNRNKAPPTAYLATDHKPFYVSPTWLHECHLQGIRVDEAIYPAILNPLSSLNIESGPDVSRAPTKGSSVFYSAQHDFDSEFIVEPKKSLLINQNGGPSSQISKPTKTSSNTNSASATSTKRGISSVYVPKNAAIAEFELLEDIESHYSRPKQTVPPSSIATQEASANTQAHRPTSHHNGATSSNPQSRHEAPSTQPPAAPSSGVEARLPVAQDARPPSPTPKELLESYAMPSTAYKSAIDAPRQSSVPTTSHVPMVEKASNLQPSAQSQEAEALLQQLAPSSQFASLPPIVHAYSTNAISRNSSAPKEENVSMVAVMVESIVPEPQSNEMQVDEHSLPTVASIASISTLPTLPSETTSLELDAVVPISNVTSEPPSVELQPVSLPAPKTQSMDVDHSLELPEEDESTKKQGESQAMPMSGAAPETHSQIGGSLPATNWSFLESQDVPPSSQSQLADPKTAEACVAQTEKMRELLALAQATSRSGHRPNRNDPLPNFSEDMASSIAALARARAPSPLGSSTGVNFATNVSRHIARSELLNLDSHHHRHANLDRSDSSPSLSSGKSDVISSDTLPDFEDPSALNSSPRGDYLHEQEFDQDQAPKVSYGSLEPSEAVKEKMLDRAETYDNASQFELAAKDELRRLAQFVNPSHEDAMVSAAITLEKESSSTSIASKRTLIASGSTSHHNGAVSSSVDAHGSRKTARTISVNSIASEDHKQSPASDTTAVVTPSHLPSIRDTSANVASTSLWSTKNPKTSASTSVNTTTTAKHSAPVSSKPIDLDADDDDCLAALEAAPSKPKAKLASLAWTASKSTTEATTSTSSKAAAAASTAAASNIFSKAKRASNAATLATSSSNLATVASTYQGNEVYLHISGFDKADRNSMLAKMAEKFGSHSATSSGPWTHFVVGPGFKTTDKYLISLANGCWVVTEEWVKTALKRGELPAEVDFEFRPNAQQIEASVLDPKPCRLAVAKQGKGLFEGLNVLAVKEPDIMVRILRGSKANLDLQTPDHLKSIKVDELRSKDIIYIPADIWPQVPARTQALVSRAPVVTMHFFIDFLKYAKYPDPSAYNPATPRT